MISYNVEKMCLFNLKIDFRNVYQRKRMLCICKKELFYWIDKLGVFVFNYVIGIKFCM